MFICLLDLFGKDRFCYTFEERCTEDLSLKLEDGTKKIFLDTKGKNTDEVPVEIIEFLKFVENTNINQNDLKCEKLKRLHQRVKAVRNNKEVEARYMTMLVDDKEIAREEGREEERNELVQNMLLEDMNISFIVTISKLPEKTVKEIKDKLIKEGKLKESDHDRKE